MASKLDPKQPASILGKLAELVGNLIGRPVRPQPALASVRVRSSRPVRVRSDWR